MSDATWREEKSEKVVEAICRVLREGGMSDEAKRQIHIALWNALKLLANAIEDRLSDSRPKWSPALVEIFIEKPDMCANWLKLMYEPEFSAEDYWKKS